MILNDLLNKAQIFLDSGNVEAAVEIFKKILPYLDKDPAFLNIFGTSYLRINKKEEGIKLLKSAFEIDSKNISTLYNLGKAYADCEEFIHAKKYLTLAYKIDSENILVINSLGSVLTHFDKFDKANNLFLKALKINPNYFHAHFNIGLLLHKKKNYLKAIESYDKAIAINPNHYKSLWNKALIKLLLGDYEEGWRMHEMRIKKKDINNEHNFYDEKKSWRGKNTIKEKILLIYGEQGYGDIIQFSRYVPLLKNYNCKVVLYVKRQLVSILKTLDEHISVIGMDEPIPKHDFNCPIMSLPLVFRTNLSNIPNTLPYLSISMKKKEIWEKKLKKTNNKKIGVVFSGSKNYKYDSLRSIEFKKFQTCFKDINSVELHSLMVDYRDGDKEYIKNSDFMISHEKELCDFSDTAALINALDLVISVDSAAAHLAGAINKQVWILIPYEPDFRWMINTTDSLWYPSAKLFRQKNKNDWDQPLKEINVALKDFVNSN